MISIVLVVALVLLAVDTYLIFDLRRAFEGAANDSTYDYVIFQDGDLFKAKNQATGVVDFTSVDASEVLNGAAENGETIFIKGGKYMLNSDAQILNKQNAKITSNGALLIGNGQKLTIKGDNYSSSQGNLLSGLTIVNGTLRIENSFGTVISNILFENCSTALELANSATWSEGTKIQDSRFINCSTSIVFKMPTGNSTGSYASTEIDRCFFNLLDNSAGIVVEQQAEFSDSQLVDVRMWMGEGGLATNQTGLLMNGSMHQTQLFGVVFESFASSYSDLYAISLGETSITPPLLSGGISFLGNWTAKILNPFGKWYGPGVFQQSLAVPVGLGGQYGATQELQLRPLTISSFKARIQVLGSFQSNETITARIRLEFIDNVISKSVEKSFNNSTEIWLSDDDMLQLLPSQGIIWAIFADVKASSASTDAVVQISVYGTTT